MTRSNMHCASMLQICLDVFEGRKTARDVRPSEREEVAATTREVIERLLRSVEARKAGAA